MWRPLIILITVGCGDVSPTTPISNLIGVLITLKRGFVAALLTDNLATAFVNQISRRYDQLKAEIVNAVRDGIINKEEMQNITTIQNEPIMSKEHSKEMIQLLRNRHQNI